MKYAVQIARALLHLYESKIAHLDLKLDNIMISSTDDIVIVDFGCAAKLDSSYCTTMNHTAGNKALLAPEVITAKNRGEKLPCEGQFFWELGVIFYKMLSGGDFPWDIDCFHMLNNDKLILDAIPKEFHSFLKNLLCWNDRRMHIVDAWKTLEILQ